jgi:uncharacterized damage-inducible protein DinB
MDEKATLHRYLKARRGDLIGKLDGLGEYDIRRPMTPTGTNLLGLVKHVASVESEYFGLTFGRPSGIELPWYADADNSDGDMWATAEESRADIVSLHERSAVHSDDTIESLPLDAPGEVPWWPVERRTVTLHQILVHMCVETARHAGHADILREMIDGSIGNGLADPNVPTRSDADWASYRAQIENAARAAADRT